MPIYDYRCRACGETTELLRPAAAADEPVACRCGRTDTVRLPSLVARTAATASGDTSLPMAGGGCCGGGCCGG